MLDILVQRQRDKKAAKKFFHKLLKGLRYIPNVIITDKLRSYSVALRAALQESFFSSSETHGSAPLFERHRYSERIGIAEADLLLFERVAAHRQAFFHRRWVDYSSPAPGSSQLLPLEDQIAGWRLDYDAMQSEMFFGAVPKFDEILKVVAKLESLRTLEFQRFCYADELSGV